MMKGTGRMCMSWQDITKPELEKLFYEDRHTDKEIAKLFGVSAGQVKYKRNKLNIKQIYGFYNDFFSENSELINKLNEQSKTRLCRQENLNWICKAITYSIFRDGPVEDLHANGQLSQADMKTLNKYMVDKIGMILSAAYDGDWLMLEMWLAFYKQHGGNWDNPDFDKSEMKRFMMLNYTGKLPDSP